MCFVWLLCELVFDADVAFVGFRARVLACWFRVLMTCDVAAFTGRALAQNIGLGPGFRV